MQNPIYPPTPQEASGIQEVFKGVVVEWVFHGQIIIYTFDSIAEDTIDHWAQAAFRINENWPSERPFLVLNDLSRVDVTPVMRQQLERIIYNTPDDLSGRYALVLADSVHTHILRQFMKGELRARATHNLSLEREIFSTRREALVWLAKSIHNDK